MRRRGLGDGAQEGVGVGSEERRLLGSNSSSQLCVASQLISCPSLSFLICKVGFTLFASKNGDFFSCKEQKVT